MYMESDAIGRNLRAEADRLPVLEAYDVEVQRLIPRNAPRNAAADGDRRLPLSRMMGRGTSAHSSPTDFDSPYFLQRWPSSAKGRISPTATRRS
jgi:hypothetical protein